MVSWHGNDFRITRPLCVKGIHRWLVDSPYKNPIMWIIYIFLSPLAKWTFKLSAISNALTPRWHHCNIWHVIKKPVLTWYFTLSNSSWALGMGIPARAEFAPENYLRLRLVLPFGVFLSNACDKFFKILYRRTYGVRTWSTLYIQLFWHLLVRFGVIRCSSALIQWVYNNVPFWHPSFSVSVDLPIQFGTPSQAALGWTHWPLVHMYFPS